MSLPYYAFGSMLSERLGREREGNRINVFSKLQFPLGKL